MGCRARSDAVHLRVEYLVRYDGPLVGADESRPPHVTIHLAADALRRVRAVAVGERRVEMAHYRAVGGDWRAGSAPFHR